MVNKMATVKVTLTPEQGGQLLMEKYNLEDKVKELKNLISMAVDRLSMPVKQIRGDGFTELMNNLRKEN